MLRWLLPSLGFVAAIRGNTTLLTPETLAVLGIVELLDRKDSANLQPLDLGSDETEVAESRTGTGRPIAGPDNQTSAVGVRWRDVQRLLTLRSFDYNLADVFHGFHLHS